MRFSIFQHSVVGGRSINQDRMGYSFTKDAVLMVLADGMGGHARGEVAAEVAMRAIGQAFQVAAAPRVTEPAQFLDSALRAAHRAIFHYQISNHLSEAPRTTVVACIVQDGFAWWAHAGDSRLYLVRKGRVVVRTRDHSKVQSLVSLGLIKESEAEVHPERNKVLNCLGAPVEPTVELAGPVNLEARDAILLCSDGLWGELPEVDIVAGLTRSTVDLSVPALVERAVRNGGSTADNTTAVALVWGGKDTAQATDLPQFHVPEGTVTTTIIMAPLDGEVADERPMEEDEIERTIAEIQSAIGRSSNKVPSR
jgi:PPM family protein phosphatase